MNRYTQLSIQQLTGQTTREADYTSTTDRSVDYAWIFPDSTDSYGYALATHLRIWHQPHVGYQAKIQKGSVHVAKSGRVTGIVRGDPNGETVLALLAPRFNRPRYNAFAIEALRLVQAHGERHGVR